MPIRLSGMVSGLDTDALVKDLVKAYSTKKDTYVKSQTKLEWKMDSWKSMNSKIYGFYTSNLSNMRFSSQYALKKATVSDSSVASVTAGSSAVNGTQTLKVKSVASTGYLTGGKLNVDMDGDAKADQIKGDTKLSDMGIASGSKINVSGKEIDITSDMTVNQFTAKLKDAGVSANFDQTNQRFFISAGKPGAESEFTMTAGNADGLKAISTLGLFSATAKDAAGNVTESNDMKEYRRLAALNDGSEASKVAQSVVNAIDNGAISEADKASYRSVVSDYESLRAEVNKYDKSQALIDQYNTQNGIINAHSESEIEEARARLVKPSEGDDAEVKYYEAKDIADMNKFIEANKDKDDLSEEDQKKLSDYQKIVEDYSLVDSYDNAKKYVEANESAYTEAVSYVDANKDSYESSVSTLESTKDAYEAAKAALNSSEVAAGTAAAGYGAARVNGKDAEIELNGATFTSSTGTFSINGLSINALQETGDKAITITTSSDTQGMYDKIKKFIGDYNTLMKDMNKAYYAESSGKYEPLTDDEKEAMTDSQIEKWETKIKDALLRRDSTLGNVSTAMKSIMQSSFEINGKSYSLSSFGIGTGNYFASSNEDKGVLHIDGDKDDSTTSGNADKLMAAINEDPDAVITFFQKLSDKMYNDLTGKMASSSVSSAYTIYNDKQMSSEYSQYKDKITSWEDRIQNIEDSYYKKFAAMEKAMSELQSKTASLGQILGQ